MEGGTGMQRAKVTWPHLPGIMQWACRRPGQCCSEDPALSFWRLSLCSRPGPSVRFVLRPQVPELWNWEPELRPSALSGLHHVALKPLLPSQPPARCRIKWGTAHSCLVLKLVSSCLFPQEVDQLSPLTSSRGSAGSCSSTLETCPSWLSNGETDSKVEMSQGHSSGFVTSRCKVFERLLLCSSGPGNT